MIGHTETGARRAAAFSVRAPRLAALKWVALGGAIALAAMLLAAPARAQSQESGQNNEQQRDDDGRNADGGGFFEELARDLLDRFEDAGVADDIGEALGRRVLEESFDQIIDFEEIAGPAGASASTPSPLGDQYLQSHGVRFPQGAAVHLCSSQYDEFGRSRCPYPRAASGQRAGVWETGRAGAPMTIVFSEPVDGFALFMNPVGGEAGESFIMTARGFDANGVVIAANRTRFSWGRDSFTWPYAIDAVPTDAMLAAGGRIARAEISLLREAFNNRPVSFLFDDLALKRSEPDARDTEDRDEGDEGAPPVGAGLGEQRAPARVRGGAVVEGPGVAAYDLEYYPPAVRKRVDIDWDAAFADAQAQEARGLAAAPIRGDAKIARAEVPVLAPIDADGGARAFGEKDTIAIGYARDGARYEVYATRLLTVYQPARRAPGVRTPVTLQAGEKAITASFSLYGGAYSLTRYCDRPGDAADCYDGDALRAEIDNLAVVLGARARGRP